MMHRLEFHAMGCKMLAVVDGGARPASLEDVPLWFEEWEKSLSRFRQESELTQFNMRAGQSVTVSDVFWEVFKASVEAENLTGGLVNPLILNALISAGYDQSFEHLQADVPGQPPGVCRCASSERYIDRSFQTYNLHTCWHST